MKYTLMGFMLLGFLSTNVLGAQYLHISNEAHAILHCYKVTIGANTPPLHTTILAGGDATFGPIRANFSLYCGLEENGCVQNLANENDIRGVCTHFVNPNCPSQDRVVLRHGGQTTITTHYCSYTADGFRPNNNLPIPRAEEELQPDF